MLPFTPDGMKQLVTHRWNQTKDDEKKMFRPLRGMSAHYVRIPVTEMKTEKWNTVLNDIADMAVTYLRQESVHPNTVCYEPAMNASSDAMAIELSCRMTSLLKPPKL